MPVGGVGGGEGPGNPFPAEPGFDHGILGDIVVVIPGDKLVVLDLPISHQGYQHQGQTDEEGSKPGGSENLPHLRIMA
jgi:hypothetical protein